MVYQDYAHIQWKHNIIYYSVYIKHGGWQSQKLLYILIVASSKYKCVLFWSDYNLRNDTFITPCTGKSNYWWQKADNSILTYILYTICIQWTGVDAMNCFRYFRDYVGITVEPLRLLTSFPTLQIVPHYCNIPIYKHDHKLINSTSAPMLTIPQTVNSLMLPNN